MKSTETKINVFIFAVLALYKIESLTFRSLNQVKREGREKNRKINILEVRI